VNYSECYHYAECQQGDCHGAECCYAESIMLSSVMLGVIDQRVVVLSRIRLGFIMLSVRC